MNPSRTISPRSYGRRRLSILLWLLGVGCLGVLPAAAQTTILFEGFEGNFPLENGWSVGDANAAGSDAYWDDVDVTFGAAGAHSGGWKGYCAAFGYGGTPANPLYQNSMAAFMSRSLDLAGYSAATLTFWHKIPSLETCCDSGRIYMDDALLWSQGNAVADWTQVSLNLNAYVGGTHILRFEFDSDGSVVAEGWYLDDISVAGTPFTPPLITVQPESDIVEACQYVFLSVGAAGSLPLSYQWRLNGTALATPGGTDPVLFVFNAQPGDSGNYDVVVANSFGAVTSSVASVTVRDTIPPVLAVPSNLTVLCVGAGGAAVTFTATATDSCDPSPLVTCTPSSGGIFPIGFTTVLCVATDSATNRAGANFTVQVVGSCDLGCIAINCPSKIVVDLGDGPATRVDFTVAATNTCSGQPYPVSCSPLSGSEFPAGTNTVTCVGSAGGASAACAFNVIVRDATPPVLKVPPSLVVGSTVTNSSGQVGAYVFFQAQAFDNAGSNSFFSINPPPGSFFPAGTNPVTCIARDGFGNQTTQMFNITVRPGPALMLDPDLAPDNWDFEQLTLAGWTATGDFTLAWQPIVGDLITVKRIPALQQQMMNAIGGDYWRNLSYPVGHNAQQWFSTAVYPEAAPGGPVDDQFSDGWIGTLLSKHFVIQKKVVTFLIGGGQDDTNLRVELLIEGQANCPDTVQIGGQTYTICAHDTGHGQELMRRESWNVAPYLNRKARIRIVDNSANGHLNVDDFRFQDLAPTEQAVAIGGRTYPAVVSFAGDSYDWDSPIWGFTDLHTHPMSYLGFGKKIMHGQPDGAGLVPPDVTSALNNCRCDHGGFGADNQCGNYWRQLLEMALDDHNGPAPHGEGWDPDEWLQFRNWPVFTTISHQQMWHEWIKRTYDGGLRVMVALCVNSTLLGEVAKDQGTATDDKTVGDEQIAELKNFVARHNDFMEIAYDPFQLRDIVRRDKLAIIIGSELDNIGSFSANGNISPNADTNSTSQVRQEIQRLYNNGVRYMFPVHLVNNKFGGTAIAGDMLNVANKYMNGQAFAVQHAAPEDQLAFWLSDLNLNLKEEIRNKIRDETGFTLDDPSLAFLIVFGGPFLTALLPAGIDAVWDAFGVFPPGGGAAISMGLAPLALVTAVVAVNNLQDTLNTLHPAGVIPVSILPLQGNYPVYPGANQAPNGIRNADGLTDLGRFAVQEMMKRGMMLDADHMSQNTLAEVFGIATNIAGGYPINSGHNGFRALSFEGAENSRSQSQIEVIRQLGGLMGVGWENGDFDTFYYFVGQPQFSTSSVANDCAGTAKTWAQSYLMALKNLRGQNVAFGTDTDGFIVLPGPRFGPQGAYGLGEGTNGFRSRTFDGYSRSKQILAQANGVLYEPMHGRALMTAAFRGRAEEAGNNNQDASRNLGYLYNLDQADFYAAMRLFYWLKPNVVGGWNPTITENACDDLANRLSDNYSTKYNDGDTSGGSKTHIANYALGLLAGINNWAIHSDLKADKTATVEIGKAVYRKMVWQEDAPDDIKFDGRYNPRFIWHQQVWTDYHKIFGQNAPMKRCVTDHKEWDFNFEGVAHYGLVPDFLQDLSNVGMESHDLSVLFRSAEHFAQMWTKCLEGSYAFVPHFTGVLQAPGGAAHAVQISFTGDGEYRLEEAPDLSAPSWQPANATLVSSNGLARTIQITPGGQSKFYRLRGM